MKSVYQKLVEQHGFSPAQKIIVGLINMGNVLEVGSSSGYMTKVFTKNGCVVDIVEPDKSAAKLAGKISRFIYTGSIEDLEIQKQIRSDYDFIVCADVLEHLVDPEQVLIFLKKRLKKTGQIVISIPNVAFWDMRLELLKGRFEYQESGLLDKTHLRFYTYNTFLAMLKRAGFEVVKTIAAEGRIPLEHTIRRIPLIGGLFVGLFKSLLMSKLPNLTYYHYVVQAKI